MKPIQARNIIEKPGLSQLVLILSYILDLAFAVVVFAFSLLATWVLHNFGNAIGVTRFLFFLRNIELVVISFGTFWCILFFVKATVMFIKEFRFQDKEEIKKVGEELLYLYLHIGDIAKRFIGTVRKRLVGYAICYIIIYAFLYTGISFAERVQDNSDDVSILAYEMICETGPNFSEQAANHTIFLANYSKYLEPRYIPSLISILKSESTENGIATAQEIMSNIDIKGSQEESAKGIWKAGEAIMLGRLKAPKFFPRGIRLHEYEEIPQELLIDIKKALEESRKALRLLKEKPTLEYAVNSCEANRATMLLSFLARNSGQNDLFDEFKEIVEECLKIKMEAAYRLPDNDPRKVFIEMTAEFDQRRIYILEALENRDMQKAIDLMWEAIDIAYSRRDALFELCEKLRNTPMSFSSP